MPINQTLYFIFVDISNNFSSSDDTSGGSDVDAVYSTNCIKFQKSPRNVTMENLKIQAMDVDAVYNSNSIECQKWLKYDDGKLKKSSHKLAFDEAVEMFNNKVAVLKKYVHAKRVQAIAYNTFTLNTQNSFFINCSWGEGVHPPPLRISTSIILFRGEVGGILPLYGREVESKSGWSKSKR